MKNLTYILRNENFTEVIISFEDQRWIESIPEGIGSGWYFIKTNTPIHVLQNLKKPKNKYPSNVVLRNYDIAARANRYYSELANLLNKSLVYSGYASNIRSRAREHVYPNHQTAALGLNNYKELHQYVWSFNYLALDQHDSTLVGQNANLVLKLGEQIWRAANGWPILCSS